MEKDDTNTIQSKLGKVIEENVIRTDPNATPEELYKTLINTIRRYHPSTDISLIKRVYELACKAHEKQKRKSGQPYIIHPLSVAIILADLELDKESIAAGILHDVVEDTEITQDEIREQFGEEIALLVDGVTKLGQLSYNTDKLELQAENLRKMFLAMAKDIRVILIKLADRLHNMRTLDSMPPEKQKKTSKETMDIYAPLAQRLGISKIKVELDDLALRYLHPEVFDDLKNKIALSERAREQFINQIIQNVHENLLKSDIIAEIYGRVKHYFSIYKKMVNQSKTIDQIYDLFAVRIIVNTVKDCYGALGVIHELYKPIPGRFKDYIAMPKQNMYQSLHTTLIGPNGMPFEIQIRTIDMHRTAEFGIAAHWRYKETGDSKLMSSTKEDEKLTWLREILEWQQDVKDNREFMSLLKSDLDLFQENVYCFTPDGDVKNLPNGSTPIDFAYSIHSAIGNKMVGARVNGKLVNIDYVIKNGDRVDIITSQNSVGPSMDWLNIVKSTQAKNKINQWFKNQRKEDNILRGKNLLLQYFKEKKLDQSKYLIPKYVDKVLQRYSFKDWDSLLAAIGHGGVKESHITHRLVEEFEKEHKKNMTDEEILASIESESTKIRLHNKKSRKAILVSGQDDVSVRFSKCCTPVPGDEIVGFVTRGRGVTIHRTDCINIINLPEVERSRIIEAEWTNNDLDSQDSGFMSEIVVYGKNRKGLLADITKSLVENSINLSSISNRISRDDVVTINMGFDVKSRDQLYNIMNKLRQIDGVFDIQRTSG